MGGQARGWAYRRAAGGGVPQPHRAIAVGAGQQLEYLSPADFDTLTAYERAAAYFHGQLKECEQKYDKLP
jgi:hypothetical protein